MKLKKFYIASHSITEELGSNVWDDDLFIDIVSDKIQDIIAFLDYNIKDTAYVALWVNLVLMDENFNHVATSGIKYADIQNSQAGIDEINEQIFSFLLDYIDESLLKLVMFETKLSPESLSFDYEQYRRLYTAEWSIDRFLIGSKFPKVKYERIAEDCKRILKRGFYA